MKRMLSVTLIPAMALPIGVGTPHSIAATPPPIGAIVRATSAVTAFWSGILRLYITLSTHAALRGVSQATIKHVLNEGRVVYRANGVVKVQSGRYIVVTNAKTGNVITVEVAGGGGGGGGW